jgi:hypothetical protein
MIALAAFEEIIDRSRVAPRIEAVLPAGVRARQLSVRTLLLRGVEDADVGGVRGADVGGVLRPRNRVAAGP